MNQNQQKIDVYFLQLVLTFQTAAWQQLGKIKNPITDKIEKNLNQARVSIDILEMLSRKTEGNRSEEETQLLKKALHEVQLNYIDEVEKEKKESEKPVDKSKEKETDDDKKKTTKTEEKKEQPPKKSVKKRKAKDKK